MQTSQLFDLLQGSMRLVRHPMCVTKPDFVLDTGSQVSKMPVHRCCNMLEWQVKVEYTKTKGQEDQHY